MAERQNIITAIVGRKGTGKTTTGKGISLKSSKKTLVVDTFDNQDYRHLPIIQPHQLIRWNKGDARIFSTDIDKLLLTVAENTYNSLIVLEDSARYYNANMSKDKKKIFVESKQHNNDIILMFHRLSEISPFFYPFIDYLVIHKTKENLKRSCDKFPDNEELMKLCKAVNYDSDNRFFSKVFAMN